VAYLTRSKVDAASPSGDVEDHDLVNVDR